MVTDSTLLEVLRLRFQSIVDEMAHTVLRTGHTVFIKETGDFGTALVTPSGEVFAAPKQIGMVRMIGMPMGPAIRRVEGWKQGDVFLSNDPLTTEGLVTHLPDLFMWKPIFSNDETIAFVWTFIHASDVGGRVPGSISPSSTDIYQEGLIIPPSKLYRAGELNDELVSIILGNSRGADNLWGDIKAALAALNHGERRVLEVVERYGLDVVRTGIDSLLDYGEKQARKIVAEIPDGDYTFNDYLEGVDSTLPTRIALKVTIAGDGVHMDFTGTDPQLANAFNLPTFGCGNHYFLVSPWVNLFCSLQPDLAYNSGIVRMIDSRIPSGSLLNPKGPVACGVRATTMHRVYDVVMGCLAQALPGTIPAAGAAGGGGISLLSVPDGDTGRFRVSVLQPSGAGSGGRPRQDGINGRDISVGAVRNIPTEVIEQELPIIVEKYGIRENEVGAGRYRGGFGLELRFRLLAQRAQVTCRGQDRLRFRPWGLFGGAPGTTGHSTMFTRDGSSRELGRIDVLVLSEGDALQVSAQGGAGYGDPLTRDARAVLDDVLDGYITSEAAWRDYGVKIVNDVLDLTATIGERRTRASEHVQRGIFATGPERVAFEAVWDQERQDALSAFLAELPPSERHYRRLAIMEEVAKAVPGELSRVFEAATSRAPKAQEP